MLVDEFYFHQQRRLPKWERWGHPLDTMTVIACFAFLFFSEPNQLNLAIYSALAIFSCLFVTKDEAVHLKYCTVYEAWLHSILFVLHPLVFISAGLIWASSLSADLNMLTEFQFLILGQMIITTGFLIYQIGYWNFYAKNADI